MKSQCLGKPWEMFIQYTGARALRSKRPLRWGPSPSLLHLWVFVFAVLSSEHASPHLCTTGSFPSPRTPSNVTFSERSPRPSQGMTRNSLTLCYLGTHSSEAELCSCPLSVFPHRMCPTRAILLANLLMASSSLSGTTQHVLIK